jgi:hypothetical protein
VECILNEGKLTPGWGYDKRVVKESKCRGRRTSGPPRTDAGLCQMLPSFLEAVRTGVEHFPTRWTSKSRIKATRDFDIVC